MATGRDVAVVPTPVVVVVQPPSAMICAGIGSSNVACAVVNALGLVTTTVYVRSSLAAGGVGLIGVWDFVMVIGAVSGVAVKVSASSQVGCPFTHIVPVPGVTDPHIVDRHCHLTGPDGGR